QIFIFAGSFFTVKVTNYMNSCLLTGVFAIVMNTESGGDKMDNKKMVINQFGSNARNYVISQIHAKGRDLDFIREVVKGGKNKVLLDVATGGGHVANALAPLFKTVTALDLTPKMLAQAEEFIESNGHDNVVFVQGDAEDLPFGDKSYDVVTCRVAPH